MMILLTKPRSARASVAVNVITIGRRRSGHWRGPGPVRETNIGPCHEGYQAVRILNFS
jgi:hypothetical protein